jgi:hypothetical protein
MFILLSTGYFPEIDALGKEKWPRGNEKVWKDGMKKLDTGIFTRSFIPSTDLHRSKNIQMYPQSPNRSSVTYRHLLLVKLSTSTIPVPIKPPLSLFEII